DTFTVSGKLLKDATEQTNLGVAFVDLNGNTIGDLTVVSACSGSGCKIKAGDQYTQTVDVQVPNNLNSTYELTIGVWNTVNTVLDPLGCAFTII
ncbi:14401_t:CDS:1, partial [Funneliformis caledonium]